MTKLSDLSEASDVELVARAREGAEDARREVASWRAETKRKLHDPVRYRARTERIAFFAGTATGVLLASLGLIAPHLNGPSTVRLSVSS